MPGWPYARCSVTSKSLAREDFAERGTSSVGEFGASGFRTRLSASRCPDGGRRS